jgi:hypothetical protein
MATTQHLPPPPYLFPEGHSGIQTPETQLSSSAAAAKDNDNSHSLELGAKWPGGVLVVVQKKPVLRTTTTSEKWKIPSSLSFFQHNWHVGIQCVYGFPVTLSVYRNLFFCLWVNTNPLFFCGLRLDVAFCGGLSVFVPKCMSLCKVWGGGLKCLGLEYF